MGNSIYYKILKKRVASFLAESNIVNELNHMGLRGDVRESGFAVLLKDLLPSTWEVGTGVIIDDSGLSSKQIDTLLFYKEALPAFLYTGSKNGVFPVESCLFAFEMKTTSTSKEIKKAIENSKSIKDLIAQHEHKARPSYSMRPIRAYFALGSDTPGFDEFARFEKLDKNIYTDPLVEIICILGKGLWYYRVPFEVEMQRRSFGSPQVFERDSSKDRGGKWWFFEANEEYFELLYFFSLIQGTVCQGAVSCELEFSRYLFDREEYDLHRVQSQIKWLESRKI